ncbi:gamma-aminobutyrate permease [Arthrobacter sp. MYb224]|uniref:amino acid permease n=1 Tax=unclassified Arthrobacter TaxID=235627 RepID=UPI000CFB4ACF|nr:MULTISPECIES: amino acid permease [unclassified Arthrobacter]PQZ97726.1 gamma-aminobutyrate permease [Arthrobacter sp. MYb224]PRA04042.1 gamma-aminobutyrate permease [Arthrobacter sp. MYb229]PRB52046.1 gamma-aminobutyrate permease [Arthrobacter sp. MYb216]
MTEPAPSTDGLKRGLKARHMQMIAIGGSIGTGLFVASGGTIAQAGPGGSLLAYALIGLMVLLLMQSLGEMSARLPVAGSFQTYASVFVNRHFGFAIGWNYWFNWAITVAAELVAAGIVMSYWLPDVPGWIWAGIFLLLLTALNALSTKAFGESEYWLAMIKVITVIVFLICGVAMVLGIMGGNSPGFSNWSTGDAPFVGGWLSVVSVFMIAGFSFQGTELVGVAAGEAENPQRDIPKAIKAIFWRIMLFYVGAIFIIGTLLPYTDPTLLASGESDIANSPFTMVFERAGIAFAAALMNAVILSAILSAGNSGLYASARMLYSMARDGKAPKIFGRLNRRGVPVPAMLLTASVGLFGFLTALIGQGSAYTWLLNVSGLSGFIAWVGIAVSHYKFRKAYIASGQDLAKLPYRAPLFPLGPILAFVILIVVIAGQNYEAVIQGRVLEVLSSYIGLPLFLLLWAGHWWKTRKQPEVKIDPWNLR